MSQKKQSPSSKNVKSGTVEPHQQTKKQTSLKENTNSQKETSDRWETAPDINVVRSSVIHFKLSQKFTKHVPFEWLICVLRQKRAGKKIIIQRPLEICWNPEYGILNHSDLSVLRVNRCIHDVTVLKALGLIAIIMTILLVLKHLWQTTQSLLPKLLIRCNFTAVFWL